MKFYEKENRKERDKRNKMRIQVPSYNFVFERQMDLEYSESFYVSKNERIICSVSTMKDGRKLIDLYSNFCLYNNSPMGIEVRSQVRCAILFS